MLSKGCFQITSVWYDTTGANSDHRKEIGGISRPVGWPSQHSLPRKFSSASPWWKLLGKRASNLLIWPNPSQFCLFLVRFKIAKYHCLSCCGFIPIQLQHLSPSVSDQGTPRQQLLPPPPKWKRQLFRFFPSERCQEADPVPSQLLWCAFTSLLNAFFEA